MRQNLTAKARTCNGSPVTVRAEGLQVANGLEADLGKIGTWVGVAHELLGQ